MLTPRLAVARPQSWLSAHPPSPVSGAGDSIGCNNSIYAPCFTRGKRNGESSYDQKKKHKGGEPGP